MAAERCDRCNCEINDCYRIVAQIEKEDSGIFGLCKDCSLKVWSKVCDFIGEGYEPKPYEPFFETMPEI